LVKKKTEKPKREVTKRQLARWQKQKRRQRFVFSAGVLIIVAIVSIILTGWYFTQYRPQHKTVIMVNDTSFDLNYYTKTLKCHSQGQPTDMLYVLADEVVWRIEQNEMVRQAAGKMGISVSNDELDAELERLDSPLAEDCKHLIRAEMLMAKLWDGYFEHEVPLFAEQGHVLAMFLETSSQAQEIRDRLEAGEDFAELAGEFSLDDFSQAEKGDFGWRPKDILAELADSPVPGDYAFNADAGVLSGPLHDETKFKNVGYWLIRVLERKEESDEAHIQAMLLGSREQAEEMVARMVAGEDFATLAKEFSLHYQAEENEGDLGWLAPEVISPTFDRFAFDPEIELETMSEPIRDEDRPTRGGYWLVKVLDKDANRKIEDEDRTRLKNKAGDEWVGALFDDPDNIVESYLDDEQKLEAVMKVLREREQ